MTDMSTTEDAGPTPRDALAVAQRALEKANEADQRAADIDTLEDRVTALELRLSERDNSTPYTELALDDKVGMVREHAFEKAQSQNGHAKLYYKDVMWEVFDGQPSAKHCYKLLRIAARGDDDRDAMPGFEYIQNPGTDDKHMTVDGSRAKTHAMFLPENNGGSEEGA